MLAPATPALASDRGPHVVAALREVLRLAVERGVAAVGRPDGFYGNPAIRILVPDQLSKVESKFRIAGQDAQIEKFVASLNRTAEHAAPAARAPLLISASEVPLDDGHRVLTGGETAATEALRRHALGRTITALSPAVAEAMARVGTAQRYKRFVKGSQFGGLVQQAPLDLDAYVVGKTVEGLFHAIAQEERRIRTDPAARPSVRLREVFGP
jgi:hypothetical protein